VRAPYRLSAPQPLAVLIGPQTASSAEVLAVALGSRAGTRSFGAPTRGLSAGNRTFPLADGASLVLTVAATSDAAGRVFTGPLTPDVAVVAAERRADGTGTAGDPVLDAALAWLAAGDACR
jgi:C-terminal processing protease CtpA/Prc